MEFEQQLLANWTRETLEAYGAALRAQNDPRGELIAIDLVLDNETNPDVIATLRESKDELQQEIFGEDAGKIVRTRYGFIESTQIDPRLLLTILEQIVPYARRLDLWGDGREVSEVFEGIVAEPRPWLATLEVRGYGDNSKTMIETALAARLAAAAPNLRRLEARGHFVFDDVSHPGIEHVIVDGHDAIGALRGGGPMPSVTVLDLALHPDFPIYREPSPDALRAGLVTRAAFPKLHTLDVSRNEPRTRTIDPNCLGGRTPIFDVLPRFEILPHLRVLRVPSLRTTEQRDALQRMIDRLPNLQMVDIARTYTEARAITHATARVTQTERVPWPAGDEVRDYDGLVFEIAGGMRVDVDDAYEICERWYFGMTPEHQAAWRALWTLAANLPDPKIPGSFSRADLGVLFASYDDTRNEFYSWNELRKKFVDAPETIAVRRINGYEKQWEAPAQPVRTGVRSERIVEHEHALQASWDLERLAVYADDLLELGDTRGELISIDIEVAAGNARSEAEYRRDELHDEIFGNDYVVKSKFGLATIDVSSWSESRLVKVFHGDTARYLRELELSGPSEGVDKDLALVLAEPRPWLRRVLIETLGSNEKTSVVASELVTLWPNLEELELVMDGYRSAFEGFAHPRVKKMRITGCIGFHSLGAPWPAVTELDFAFGVDQLMSEPESILTSTKLPALRVLDLSRNEPASESLERDRFQCSVRDFFACVRALDPELLGKLTHLRLPSPRDTDDVFLIQAMLLRMPALEYLEIVRRYPGGPNVELRHPHAKLVIPAPCTWVPADQIADRDTLIVDKAQFPLTSASLAMERHYDALPTSAQLAWDELWSFIGTNLRRFEYSAAKFYAAIEALQKRDDYSFDDACEKLMAALHGAAIAEKAIVVRIAPET